MLTWPPIERLRATKMSTAGWSWTDVDDVEVPPTVLSGGLSFVLMAEMNRSSLMTSWPGAPKRTGIGALSIGCGGG